MVRRSIRLGLAGGVLAALVMACSVPSGTLGVSRAADAPPSLARMTGVNWFGFETSLYVPHGLWSRDYRSMLQQMRDLGFNTIRVPFSDAMLDKTPSAGLQINAYGADPYTHVQGINTDLAGLTSLQILDKIIDYAGSLGLRIVLDNHSREADGYYNQTLWYTANVSESQWIADWVMLATRYKDKANVVAFDLSNEPHGGYIVPGMTPAATWGFDLAGAPGPTNWKAAAERCAAAIMAVNTRVIFIIQGVQDYEGTNYWWGSNLRGVKVNPITTIPKNRLMYSVHEYGPEVHSQDWFTDPTFPANLPSVWRDDFYFIYEQGLAGLYIGEIGIKEDSAGTPSSVPYKWYTSFLQFAGSKLHFTFWSWNPDSGDTGGILKDDWLTVNPNKYGLLKPYLEPVGATPTPTPTASPTATPTPTATPSATPTPTPTPSPVPTPTANPGSLKLEYSTTGAQAQTNTIGMKFKLTNSGSAVALSALKLRYYYTSEPKTANSMVCDYAGLVNGSTHQAVTSSVTGTVTALSTPKTGADRYLEVGFVSAAPTLAASGTVEVQLRVTAQDWSSFTQTDDYSFLASALSYTANAKIVLLKDGTAVSGAAP